MIKSVFISLLVLTFFYSYADTWTQKASITGARDAVMSFSIGTKGYICGGYNSGTFTFYKDFWEWDLSTNVWTQKADFGGGFRSAGIGFSIGNKGYIGTGDTAFSNGGMTKDFWEWDGDTASATYDTWTQRSSLPGTARFVAIGFSIGSKGYIGTGNADQGAIHLSDFWEWDQATDNWSQKSDFGGGLRQEAAGFSIGNKGYIGTGSHSNNNSDFWEWDQATGVWTQKAHFGGPP